MPLLYQMQRRLTAHLTAADDHHGPVDPLLIAIDIGSRDCHLRARNGQNQRGCAHCYNYSVEIALYQHLSGGLHAQRHIH